MVTEVAPDRQGIQSIELGMGLLKVLADHGRPMKLRDLSAAAEMAPAKAHRYLVSFMRMGLVDQDAGTSRYRLGDFALHLGLSALRSLDPVQLASPILQDLCDEIHETVALAVWGGQGPTVVRTVDAGDAITVSLRTGAVLPLFTSATGRNFSTYCRTPAVKKMLEAEIQAYAGEQKLAVTTVKRSLEKNLAEVRKHGIARATGSVSPGINGFSAPVFDHGGTMVAAITSLGALGNFDTEWDSSIARAIRRAALGLPQKLGYQPQPETLVERAE